MKSLRIQLQILDQAINYKTVYKTVQIKSVIEVQERCAPCFLEFKSSESNGWELETLQRRLKEVTVSKAN